MDTATEVALEICRIQRDAERAMAERRAREQLGECWEDLDANAKPIDS